MTLTLCRRCIFDLPAVVCRRCIQWSAHLDLNTPASRNTGPMLRSLITVVAERSRLVMKLSAYKRVPFLSLSISLFPSPLSLSLRLLKLFYAFKFIFMKFRNETTIRICIIIEKNIPIYNYLCIFWL